MLLRLSELGIVGWIKMNFPDKKYHAIYADPPWTYRDKANSGQRGAGHKYPCMTLSDLMQLPINQIADKDCVLFMWHVPPMPMEALKLVEAWGFKFSTMKGFTWIKLNKQFARVVKQYFAIGHDELMQMTDHNITRLMLSLTKMGMGNFTRTNSEDCLIAVRGNGLKRINAGIKNTVFTPYTTHSQKPDEVRQGIVELIGDVPRIELFARQRVEGWDAWGNEL